MPKGIYKRKPLTEEHKRNIREANINTRFKKGHPKSFLGKRVHSIATREKMSKTRKGTFTGENSHNWIKDRTKLQRFSKQGERRAPAYFFWRKSVWVRDNWKCKISNSDCNGRIEAHHILSWRDYPELRYSINNGITLCHAHHPRRRAEEKRLIPKFQELVSVSKESF